MQEIILGEGSIYHPGGMDSDGRYIWVPVCEYRPNGASILYRIDPASMAIEKMKSVADAIGAVVYNPDNNQLTGMNWDARKFYRWQYKKNTGTLEWISTEDNNHHFIRYQDCNYIGNGIMICSGLRGYYNGIKFRLGGLQAIRLQDYAAVFDTPVPVWKRNDIPLNSNPFFCEKNKNGVALYFVPEDDSSTMYIYEWE